MTAPDVVAQDLKAGSHVILGDQASQDAITHRLVISVQPHQLFIDAGQHKVWC